VVGMGIARRSPDRADSLTLCARRRCHRRQDDAEVIYVE
jgi:hypothetical protein